MAILFPYFELAASLFILFLAFETISRHYQNKLARFFSRLALIAFLSAIFEYSVRIAPTLDFAQNIQRLAGVFWAFLFPAFTHFCLLFAGKDKQLQSKWALPLLYGPAMIVASLFLFTNYMTTRFEIWSIGIIYQPAPLYWLYTVETFIYVSYGILTLYRTAGVTRQESIKHQASIIATGTLIALLIGGFCDEILPLVLGQRIIFPAAVFALTLMNLSVYVGMRRYSLFSVYPGLVAETIIDTMPDSLIVTDLDGQILLLNEEAHKYFKVPREEILGRRIGDLFEDKEKYNQLICEVVDKGLSLERFEVKLCDPLGECLPSFINAKMFRNTLGTVLGITFIIRDIRG